MQKCAFFRRFFTTTQQVTVAPQIGDREANLRIELHISYTDQFVVPPIFKYLIGAKDVEIRLAANSTAPNERQAPSFRSI